MAAIPAPAATDIEMSLLKTPHIPITLDNLAKYMAEVAQAFPKLPLVQVLCACDLSRHSLKAVQWHRAAFCSPLSVTLVVRCPAVPGLHTLASLTG